MSVLVGCNLDASQGGSTCLLRTPRGISNPLSRCLRTNAPYSYTKTLVTAEPREMMKAGDPTSSLGNPNPKRSSLDLFELRTSWVQKHFVVPDTKLSEVDLKV